MHGTLLEQRIEHQLASERAQNLVRQLPAIADHQGTTYLLNGRRVVGFCSNDYLGLGLRLSQVQAVPGATASRLICGDHPSHRELEHRLAEVVGYPDAVLFPSGFQLNSSVPACLVAANDQVFSDRLNHASLIDGLRLTKADKTILRHRQPPPAPHPKTLCWWFTESFFSMDGDTVLPNYVYQHVAQGGLVYLDEAHSLGLYEKHLTFSGHHNVCPTLLVGTCGKALGCAGAFVASSRLICQWIRTHARGMVFSTGVSPHLIAAIQCALDLVLGCEGQKRRAQLRENLHRLSRGLGIEPRVTPIIPLIVGSNEDALTLSRALSDRGFHVQAIRPPTVPHGASRLRLTISASHLPEQIDALTKNIRELFGARKLPICTRVDRERVQRSCEGDVHR